MGWEIDPVVESDDVGVHFVSQCAAGVSRSAARKPVATASAPDSILAQGLHHGIDNGIALKGIVYGRARSRHAASGLPRV